MRYRSCEVAVTTQIERVVIGVSGSVANLAALRVAVDQARGSGAPLVALHAWKPVGGEIAYRRAPCPVLLDVWKQAARDRLMTAFEEAFGGVPDDVRIDRVLMRAEPGPALIYVAGHPTDLLVIGTGRRSQPTGTFHIGVSHYCLSHASCPVLAVPPPDMIHDLRRRHRWQWDAIVT
jgi:nucleotide-binding universal stress UspA family protein